MSAIGGVNDRTPARVAGALREAASDIGRSWDARAWVLGGVAVVAAAAPAFIGPFATRAITAILYLSIAAVGLNLVMGLGDMPSIGHGAFVGVGALTAALLRTEANLSLVPATLGAVLAVGLAASLVGMGAMRLRSVHLAIASWIGAWLFTLATRSLPGVSGGAGGIPVPAGRIDLVAGFSIATTNSVHYELALLLLVLALLGFRSLATSPAGLALSTMKQDPSAATALGSDRRELRLVVFVVGAVLAGMSGALGVQASGVFDQSAYGILLSVALFVAVLVGGTTRTFGPLIGVALIALIPLPGVPLVALVHVPGRAAAVIPGIILFVALFVRGTRAGNGPASAFVPPSRSVDRDPPNTRPGPHIEIRGLSKSFGGVDALTDLDLEMAGGTIHGVMGPNGSGKTTLLRILAGELAPDSGRIAFDGVDVTDLSVRARIELGVRRTPQSTSLFPDLTPAAHVLASRLPYRRSAGFFRSLLRTPASRRETDEMTQSIPTVLQPFGLVGKSDVPTGSLSFGDQRSLMVALAAQGNVILLDEPSAGLTVAEIRPLAAELRSLRDRGAALIVVEHNLRLLQKVANVISVLDGGRLIARGEPSRVYEDADVKRAYLGTKRAAI